jgi:glycosyltransferase involved in cell wall biosynthesis
MARRITVMSNGVDTEVWRPDAAVRASLRSDLALHQDLLWFAAGRLDPVKDYPTLLLAMAQLPHTARLVIAGGGPCERELRQLSANLGLESRVRFLGFEQNVLRWMQAADGFVLSSRWEGLPMVLLEAAACAVPVVATDVPGTREVVVQGCTGWLATAGEPALLAESMLQLMHTPIERRRTMGQQARQHVLDHFSLEAALDRWEALYQQLLLSHPKPHRRGMTS